MVKWQATPDFDTHKKNSPSLGAIIILLLILAVLFSLMQPSDAGQAVVFSDQYIQHTVSPGETLWGIAKQYRPDADPREIIYEIQVVNEITPLIRPGMEIWVPRK